MSSNFGSQREFIVAGLDGTCIRGFVDFSRHA